MRNMLALDEQFVGVEEKLLSKVNTSGYSQSSYHMHSTATEIIPIYFVSLIQDSTVLC